MTIKHPNNLKTYAAETLLAARYLLLEAAACMDNPAFVKRHKRLDREIEHVLNQLSAGLGNQ